MSNTTNKKTAQGVRYTDIQKKEIVDFVVNYNATNSRGGQSAAVSKFKISPITVGAWLKAAGAKTLKVEKSSKAPKAVKTTHVVQAAKTIKAPQAAKTTQAPKVEGKGSVGIRYSAEEKQEVVDFVASHNAKNGRGGQSTAASKFKISPLTVMAWLKTAGVQKTTKKVVQKGVKYIAPDKAAKATGAVSVVSAAASGGIQIKLNTLLALSGEIVKTQAELAQLHAKFATLKASL